MVLRTLWVQYFRYTGFEQVSCPTKGLFEAEAAAADADRHARAISVGAVTAIGQSCDDSQTGFGCIDSYSQCAVMITRGMHVR